MKPSLLIQLPTLMGEHKSIHFYASHLAQALLKPSFLICFKMKKLVFVTAIMLVLPQLWTLNGMAADAISTIESVKLYQNQALVMRKARVTLQKGLNRITLKDLPPNLYDWSVRGGFGSEFKGTINSVDVTKNALTQRRRERLLKIEDKLSVLQDQDLALADDLKTVAGQVSFLESVMDFTKVNAAKELAAQVSHPASWDGTLNYVKSRMKDLLKEKRKIEKDRETLGKDIQKWEFDLFQVGGANYYKNYLSIKNTMKTNRSILSGQQFDKGIYEYAEYNKELQKSGGPMEYEKQVELEISSPASMDVEFELSYLIPGTQWDMKYDIRADENKKNLEMTIYGDIRQTTGEDWSNIHLALSTGQPVQSIVFPVMERWYIDVISNDTGTMAAPSKYYGGAASQIFSADSSTLKAGEETISRQEDVTALTSVEEKGINVEMTLPLKQNIPSEQRSHKKMIRDFTLSADNSSKEGGVRFFYELVPSKQTDSIIKIAVTNNSALPWLEGEAQIFLDNEFMGKTTIPFTPKGMEREIVLGTEKRISGKKELIKKYEDNTGLFSGRRRILYSYKITLQNDCTSEKGITLHDMIPVSRNEKIEVEIGKLSHPFEKDAITEKSADFAQGKRTWKLTLSPHQKSEITFNIVVTFDKDLNVKGLR